MTFAFAASLSPLLPSLIAAASSLVSAALLGALAWRAQSAKQQLEEIAKLVDDAGERTAKEVKKALRDVIGTDPKKRRWYE